MKSRVEKHHLDKLRSQLPHIPLVLPDSPDYPASISRWNPRNERKAGAVAFPSSATDVSQLICFARHHLLQIAVKGGGQGNRGSSTNGGLCIDLSKMRSVTVDPSGPRVIADGGAVWSDVYEAISKHRLAVVSGISPSVGVGGLSLHGGHGWLTGAHGLAVDQILEVEVVLADGNIICTSETENPSLFWAVRGAGGAFGVITKFFLRAFEQPNDVWTGRFVLHGGHDNLKAIVNVSNLLMSLFTRKGEGTPPGVAAMYWGWSAAQPGTEPTIWAIPWYNGSEVEAKKIFAPLFHCTSVVQSTKVVPFTGAVVSSAGTPGKTLRKFSHGSAIMAPLDISFFQNLYHDYLQFTSEIPDAAQRTLVMFEVHHPEATMKKGQTETAYANRGNQINVQVAATWTERENDAICEDWCRKFTGAMATEFQQRKQQVGIDALTKDSVGICPNYDGRSPIIKSCNSGFSC